MIEAPLLNLLVGAVAGAASGARVFPITDRRINYIVKATAQRAGINPAASAHSLRQAHASHAVDEGAPIGLADARACRFEDHERLCARQAQRQLQPLSQEDMTNGPRCSRDRFRAASIAAAPVGERRRERDRLRL